MLWTLALLPTPSPSPGPATEMTGGGGGLDFNAILPLLTGTGGALAVLLLVFYLFQSDRITTSKAVDRLREADNNRFNDMVDQRDTLVIGLERANATAATSADNAAQSLELLHEVMAGATPATRPPPRKAPRKRPAT